MNDWQPIETAPRDGKEILVFNGQGGYCIEAGQIGVAYFTEVNWEGHPGWMSSVCCDGVSRFEPTHWMPLPDPPLTHMQESE